MNNNQQIVPLSKEDFIEQGDRFIMTAQELGKRLGFKNPFRSIKKIYYQHRKWLEPFKGVYRVGTPGGEQDSLSFDAVGCYYIAMKAIKPEANDFALRIALFIDNYMKNAPILQSQFTEMQEKIKRQEEKINRIIYERESRDYEMFIRKAKIIQKSPFMINLRNVLSIGEIAKAFNCKEKVVEELFLWHDRRQEALENNESPRARELRLEVEKMKLKGGAK